MSIAVIYTDAYDSYLADKYYRECDEEYSERDYDEEWERAPEENT